MKDFNQFYVRLRYVTKRTRFKMTEI